MLPEKLQQLSRGFQLLGNPTRLRIYKYLLRFKDDPESSPTIPTILATQLGLTLPTMSYNLKQMHEADMLHRRRSGRLVFYWINTKSLVLLQEFFK